MALAVSVVQSCGTCFGEKCLRSVITFEAEKGYMNVLCNKMRFKNFLFSRVSKLCSQSKHKIAERLLEEVDRYEAASVTDRSKLLNKVSVLMGYNSLHDLIQSERAQKDSGMNVKDTMVDFDVSLACKRFPSIILGCSPAVELYDETSCWSGENSLLTSEICKGFLSSSVGAKWLIPDNLREAWPPLYPGLPNANSNLFREESSYASPLSSQSLNLESETNSVLYVTTEESSTRAGFESVEINELILLIDIEY